MCGKLKELLLQIQELRVEMKETQALQKVSFIRENTATGGGGSSGDVYTDDEYEDEEGAEVGL